MSAECCDFSPPASRTARRSSTILEGVPAGSRDRLRRGHRRNCAAVRRGYGRGRRMAIESDRAEPLSGIRHGAHDRRADRAADSEQGLGELAADDVRRGRRCRPAASGADRPPVTRPRPGHADLAGVVKYGHDDIRNVLERASARETAARVAVGAIARQLLGSVGTEIVSHVVSIGSVAVAGSAGASPSRTRPRHRRRHAAALRRRGCRAADDRGDRSRPRGRRHDGRQLRGHRARRAARPRQPRALGSQARWPPGAGADVDSRDQGGRHRPRPGRRRRCPARGSTTRSSPRAGRAPGAVPASPADQQRRRPRRRRHQRRGPAGHGLHEADRDADEAAALGRSRDDDREPGGDRTQRRLRRPGRRGRRRGDGRDRPRRCADREVRRRFDRGAGRQLAGLPGAHGRPLHPTADR